jgi:hypothetical protein
MSRMSPGSAQAIVLAAINRAAEAGEPCPSNNALCELAGAQSPSFGSGALNALVRAGLIQVERFAIGREVTITATGKKTLYTGCRNPHWRTEGRVSAEPMHVVRRPRLKAVNADTPDDEHLPPPVARDPCPRCGTRRDLGCRHSPNRISMGAF